MDSHISLISNLTHTHMYNTQEDDNNKQQTTNAQPVAQGTQTNATQQGSTQTNAQTPVAQGTQTIDPNTQDWINQINAYDTYAKSNIDTTDNVDYKSQRAQLRNESYKQRKSATQSMLDLLTKRQGELRDTVDPSTLTQEEIDALPPEEYKRYRKQLRRQRAGAIISALGDGISAISNIVATRKGAKSTYDPSQSVSKAWADRYETQRKQREANKEQYYNYEAQKQRLINDDATWERQLEKDEEALTVKQQEQDRKNLLARIQFARNMAAANKDEAMTAYYDELKSNLAAGMVLKQAESQARVNYLKARAAHVGSSGSGSSGGRKGSGGKDYTETTTNEYKTITNTDGTTRTVKTGTTKKRVYNNGSGKGKKGKGGLLSGHSYR